MAKQRAKSKEQRTRGKEYILSLRSAEGGEAISKSEIPRYSRNDILGVFSNEKGIALVMILVLSAIALAIMAGLIYMITTGTQISGMQKRYKTALEAGIGGADVTYQFINLKDNMADTTSLYNNLKSPPLSLNFNTPNTCVTHPTAILPDGRTCISIGSYIGVATKLNLPTSCWSGCDSSMTIDPNVSTTYDLKLDLGASPYPTYRVYTKIVDTVWGNTLGGEEELLKYGVVTSGSGEIAVMSIPYLYAIEVDAENPSNPAERAKLSILYQY